MSEHETEDRCAGGARYVVRPDHHIEPLSPPWLEAVHERRDELARHLDANLKQLKRVIDESKLIAQQLEEVLEEIRTAGEDFRPEKGRDDEGEERGGDGRGRKGERGTGRSRERRDAAGRGEDRHADDDREDDRHADEDGGACDDAPHGKRKGHRREHPVRH